MARRALCIGINRYPDTGRDLLGSVNDAKAWAGFLGELEDQRFSVTSLHDEQASLQAMREAIRELVTEADDGDSLVITFSGHGACMTPDAGGEERSGWDQGLAPSDFASQGPLLDDEVRQLFNQRRGDVKLLLIADCCHSGSINRAVLPRQAGPALRTQRERLLPPECWPEHAVKAAVAARAAARAAGHTGRTRLVETLRDDDVLMAACQDGPQDTAAEIDLADDSSHGAFSYFALEALRELTARGASWPVYRQWLDAIERRLPNTSQTQKPQWFFPPGARERPVFA
ncbi:MAG: caspase family protein [Burkholderiaceae bacterium]